jgi:hypothetical protein
MPAVARLGFLNKKEAGQKKIKLEKKEERPFPKYGGFSLSGFFRKNAAPEEVELVDEE